MSPSLKYFDPATQTYKYVVGGQSQESADARYLLSGFRNVLRNGDMSIAQRGDGPITGSGILMDATVLDSINGTVTLSRLAASAGALSREAVLVVSGQAATSSRALIWHGGHEDVRTLSGQTATVSFTARAASGSPLLGVSYEQYFGTGGSPSAGLDINIGKVTLSTTPTRYSLTFTVPSTTGKTLGTNGDSSFWLGFHGSAGSTSTYYAASGSIGVQNNTFYITDIQLEAGNVATPFERLPVQQQLAWCQRYFQRIGAQNPHMPWLDWNPIGVAASFGGGAWARVVLESTVLMRAKPSALVSNPANFSFSVDGADVQTDTANVYPGSLYSEVTFHAASPTGIQNNNTVTIYQWGNLPAYFDMSAEL